jgi:MYXO-CTERM domain-containing protein
VYTLLLLLAGAGALLAQPPDDDRPPIPERRLECRPDDYECWLERLQQAYEIAPLLPILVNLARVSEKLDRKPLAIEYYKELKERCAEPSEDSLRPAIQTACAEADERIAALLPHVVEVIIDVRGPLESLRLGGRSLPLDARSAFADPGEVTLRATWKDRKQNEKSISARGGDRVSILLEPPIAPPVAPRAAAPHPSEAGCACEAGPARDDSVPGIAALALVALARRRRR